MLISQIKSNFSIMKIGNIDLGNRPVMLAPMEDVTDPSFRLICREQGADMVYTEFVSADALIRNVNSTTRKLCIQAGERWLKRQRLPRRQGPTYLTSTLDAR